MNSDDIDVVRHPQARRAKLAFDPATGRARLTLPPRAALKPALAWARAQHLWVEAQRARLPESRPFAAGAEVPFDGEALTIHWSADTARRVVRAGDRLVCGGPAETLARRVEAWLRRQALDRLSTETAEFAEAAGVTIARVAVGDSRGRWGSCSGSGTIRYSWRLICAPVAVRRATVAHEVAHRVHMNHSAEFHALVAQLYGRDPKPERQWLRSHGAALHWLGRSPG